MTDCAPTHAGSTHAHPPTPPKTEAPPELHSQVPDRSSSTYYDHAFRNGLRLKGLPGEDRTIATDVYCPEVRRSYFSNDFAAVNHLDLVSCWRGLNLKQAEEVIIWERAFNEALHGQISDNLRGLVPTLPLTHDGNFNMTHYVDIDLESLVHAMVARYFSCKPDIQRERTWSMSDKDLPSFAYNFVRTRDCFIDTSPRPYVQMNLCFSLASSSIFGNVIWQPFNVAFGDLPITVPFGERYSIHPEYRSPDYGNTCGPGFAFMPDYIEYSADSQKLKLQLSHEKRSFTAVAPFSSETMETKLTAKSTMHFPGGVRYERTSRYSIKFFVPSLQRPTGIALERPHQRNDIVPKPFERADSMSPEVTSTVRQNATGSKIMSYAEWKQKHIEDVIAMLEEEGKEWARVEAKLDAHGRTSPIKRKAEKQVPVGSIFDATESSKAERTALDRIEDIHHLELTSKRQRLAQHDSNIDPKEFLSPDLLSPEVLYNGDDFERYIDGLGQVSTFCKGEARADSPMKTTPSPKKPLGRYEFPKSRAYTASTGTSRVMPTLRKKGSVKRMVFDHRIRARRADSPVEVSPVEVETKTTPRKSPYSSRRLKDLAMALDGASGDPVQAAIRDNYNEFVSKASHVKMNSEEAREKQVYESFFLDSSPDEASPSGASSVSEDLSEGLSAMSLDED